LKIAALKSIDEGSMMNKKRSDGHGYSCQGNFMTKDIPSCYGASTFVKFGEVCKLLSCLESIQQEMSSEYAYQLSAAF
jgi:hypothetical protein